MISKRRRPLFSSSFFVLIVCLVWSCAKSGDDRDNGGQIGAGLSFLNRLAFLSPSQKGPKPFFLSCFEITVGEFKRYLSLTGRTCLSGSLKGEMDDSLLEEMPVRRVTPREALAFAKWRGMRLPRLDEWEWAVGGRGSFPWGRTFSRVTLDQLKCNTAKLGLARPSVVGTFELGAATGYLGSRIYDLIGNVEEWVRVPFDFSSLEEDGLSPEKAVLSRIAWRQMILLFSCFSKKGFLSGISSSIAPLGPEGWDILRRPWVNVGWSFDTRVETKPGYRIPKRKGFDEYLSTAGFRTAAWPEDLVKWLASKNAPYPDGENARALARFFSKYRFYLSEYMNKPPDGADPARWRVLRKLFSQAK